jgi:hypothetical protein
MNAASAGGETGLPLSELDLKAFDAIGWDRADLSGPAVPEPTAAVVFGLGFLAVAARERRSGRRR